CEGWSQSIFDGVPSLHVLDRNHELRIDVIQRLTRILRCKAGGRENSTKDRSPHAFLFNSSADIVSILCSTFPNISISAGRRSALSFSMQPSAGPASR